MDLNEKIKTLRENRKWTQAHLANLVSVSPDAVSSWERGINTPPLAALKDLAKAFDTTVGILTDDAVEVTEFYKIETVSNNRLRTDVLFLPGQEDSDHTIYEADLKKGALLHRFNNPAGTPYSAIYIGGHEIYSCERTHEQQMINYWNEQ